MAEQLHKKIKLIRCKLGEFKKMVSDFSNLDKSLKDSDVFLNLQVTEITEEFKKVKELHEEVSCSSEEDDEVYRSYVDDHIFSTIKTIYFKHSTNLHGFLKIVNASERCDLTFTEFSQAAYQRAGGGLFPHSALPELNLSLLNANIEPFDGSYDKWADFKDSFCSNVHENNNLNDGAKLKILQSLLKGDAQKLLKREYGSVKASDYEDIWLKLKKRFDNKRALINSYFSVLFYQPIIEKESADSLKTLYDTSFDTLVDLKKLDLKVDAWGDILLFLIHSKLPLKTKELWDERVSRSDKLPTFSRFMEFVEQRFRTLESLETTRKAQSCFQANSTKMNTKKVSTFQTTKTIPKINQKSSKKPQKGQHGCRVCKEGTHSLRNCEEFLKLDPIDKKDKVKSLGYCLNCFSYSHKVPECFSKGRCSDCGQKHHSLLHLAYQFADQGTQNDCKSSADSINKNTNLEAYCSKNMQSFSTCLCETDSNIIFPTAIVKVSSPKGSSIILRAIIDTCSDVSYITEYAVKKLGVTVSSTLIQARGVGDTLSTESKAVASFKLHSLVNKDFTTLMKAYVLPTISSERPTQSFNLKYSNIKSKLLADPNFNVKSRVDLLLGGGIDALIRMSGMVRSQYENINFQQTRLGWIVSGSIGTVECFLTSHHSINSLQLLDQSIRSFWELEEVPQSRILTKEEQACESIYDNTTNRLTSGEYMVSLPFKVNVDSFKDMRKVALKRFACLERRLLKNINLKNEYAKCLNEYIELGHMFEVDPQQFPNAYYIPHHCVFKESSSTTKLRVVFDASAKDENLLSLNECLLNGPRLQDDLLDLLIRFRFYKIAFTADIAKMYRQILINPNDYKFQLIVWRDEIGKPIKTFAMKTVTFGTTSAPYLAVKTLYRLADDEEVNYPLAAQCLRHGFYVDDCIYGADTVEEAINIQTQVLKALKGAGFQLRKWSSNSSQVLVNIPDADKETSSILNFDDKCFVKTLGIQWSPETDNFLFNISLADHEKPTKRTVLSDIAKIFDPMGLVSPCIITLKILIQTLWTENRSWDEPLSSENLERWTTIKNQFSCLKSIVIPRWLQTIGEGKIEIHGFSDASQKAYAAAVYVKTISDNNKVVVSLLFAKTKVAPLKQISLPRLELMGAVLLAKMVDHLKRTLKISKAIFRYWSDSEITLAWIRDDPHKRTVFVANRITEIQSLSSKEEWKYVHTLNNPADLGTRGVNPSFLPKLKLWWQGPEFLKTDKCNESYEPKHDILLPSEDNVKLKKVNPKKDVLYTFLSARKPDVMEIVSNVANFSVELLNKYSALPKLVRIVSYCLRFLKRNRKEHTFISPQEYDSSLLIIIKMVQEEVFGEELRCLQASEQICKQSSIYSLYPIINPKDGTLRVSGRLANASHLNYDQRFPVILPKGHILSQLIVRHAHLVTLHGTNQETTIMISQRYHIIRCNQLVKYLNSRCIKCYRLRCKAQQQLMGILPKYRITPNRPFLNCGVDFAGPFELKKYKGRCSQTIKSYFAIFICFSTKAIHLEVVADLSTTAFIAAYRRFISRRGLVLNLHSDCGTNFIGAKKTLTRSAMEVQKQWHEDISKELAEFKTNWHFNPPGAPHFGGLWEAGVKSVKYHLKRVVGETRLTYDEFETILVQVEAILNSRPLCPISNDPNTLVLTPAHFLIQDSLLSLPDNNLESARISLQDRWNMIQKLVQRFWKLWSDDYLNTLRQRKKWKISQNNIKIGDVVIVRENNLPPNSWVLGLVTETHPGSDGLTRVVTLKSKGRTYQRPVVKLSPLPI